MKKRNLKKQNTEKRNKKGEIMTDSGINMILLGIGVIVIIILIGMIAYYTLIKERGCHDSIVMRSSVNYGVFSTARIIPLQCTTEKMCLISDSKGSCPIFGVPTKDNNILRENLDSNDHEKAKQQVLDYIATQLYQCHTMLGEGQLLFMKQGVTDKNYCLICSRIVLDEKSRAEVPDITYSELYQYLSRKKTSDGKSYLEAMHPQWTDWRSSQLLFRDMQAKSNNQDFKNLKFEDWKIDLSNSNGTAIIAQIAPTGYWKSFAATGGAVLVVLATATGVGAPATITMIAVGGSSIATFWYTSPGGKFEYSPPEIFPYDINVLQNLGCNSFETAP